MVSAQRNHVVDEVVDPRRARYFCQCTDRLKNLSSPNRIGATVKPMRSSQTAWWAALLTLREDLACGGPLDGGV